MGGKAFAWRNIFSLDLRSLALFRIVLGVCLFLDLTYRLFYIEDFYTDRGVMPRAALVEKFMGKWEISLHLMNGTWQVQLLIFLIAIAASLCLIVGYHTRVSAFVSWVLMCSMQTRNLAVLHGGDDMFRVLLFWSQFVPLAAEYSFDKYLNHKKSPLNFNVLSVGTAGLTLQMCFLYFFTALLKWHPIWHTEGSAVYYALSLDEFSSPVGLWLLKFPEFLRVMTFATLGLEFFGPLVVLSPLRVFNSRMLVCFAFISFHVGLAITMELGLFPWVCIAGWLALLPAEFWEKSGRGYSPIFNLARYFRKWPTPPEARIGFSCFNQFLATIMLSLILFWNLTHFESLNWAKPQWVRAIMNMTATYQKWSMFAPYPRRDDGWYVVDAVNFKGEHFDPWAKDHVLRFEKPDNVANTYRNSMWRKYLTNLWLQSYREYRLYFGRYLCRTWNEKHEHPDQIDTMRIYYVVEMTPRPGETPEPLRQEGIWRHYCFEKPQNWEQ